MDVLASRSPNVVVKSTTVSKKEIVKMKAATNMRVSREKDHPPDPPSYVFEPNGLNGEAGEKYKTGGLLGKGGFAICHKGELCTERYGGFTQAFALKIVKTQMSQKKLADKFRTELQIHSKLRHPNIVEFHRAFAFEENTYVVLELCPNGSVMDMVRQRRCLSLPEVRRLTIQLCGAVKHMHHRNVIHRDLKMGNLFLDSDMNMKVGDFGLAAILVTDKEAKGFSRRTTLCGTPNYIAPEILEKGRRGHDHKVDLWAIGIIVFAMITGYPPFQSSTQDEIYRKVKDLNYAWPTDANFQNHVPEEAKNLVSSLLKVDAVERPEPDEIVGHEFFLMHNGDGIPGTLDSSCRRAKPSWLRQRHPIGDSMDPAARIPWTQICCQCGVGTKPGSVPFPVSGQYTATTIYKQCVEEEGEGRTPTVPIPEDMVYTSYPGPERWPPLLPPSVPDESFKINKAKGPSRKILKVVQTHAAAPLEQQLESKDFGQQIDVKLRPQAQAQDMKWPRPTERQSHAAQLRQKAQPLMSGRLPATRLRSTTTANPTVRSGQKSLVSAAEPATVRGLLTDLPIRRPSRSASTKSKLEPQSHNPVRLTRSHTAPGDISNESSDGKRVGQPLVTTTPVTLGTVVEEAHVRPTNERRTRSATTRGTPYVAVSDRSAGDSQTEKKHTYGQQSLNPRRAKTEYRSAGLSNSRQVLIGPDDDAEGLPFTASFSVSQALRRIFSNLGEALDKAPSGKKGKIDSEDLSSESIKDRPIVVKWVDYSNRHGVGYILDDGSVGCVFKSVIGDPPTCIVVRGGEEHLRKSKLVTDTKKHRIVPEDGQPVEFYENYGDGGIKRVLVQPAEFQMEVGPDGNVEKLNPGKDTFEFQKKKTVWMYHKFAKYMTQSSGKGEEDQGSPAHEGGKKNGKTVAKAFVKFYQRIGNVGVWGFGSGTFQFNFPDHTKVVISPDGKHCDFYHLPLEAVTYLKQNRIIPDALLEQRDVLSYSVSTLLRGHSDLVNPHAKLHVFKDLVVANCFGEKLAFVKDIVRRWYECGGLGRLGEGEEAKIKWHGRFDRFRSANPDKLVWVTVGAKGGDGPLEARVPR